MRSLYNIIFTAAMLFAGFETAFAAEMPKGTVQTVRFVSDSTFVVLGDTEIHRVETTTGRELMRQSYSHVGDAVSVLTDSSNNMIGTFGVIEAYIRGGHDTGAGDMDNLDLYREGYGSYSFKLAASTKDSVFSREGKLSSLRKIYESGQHGTFKVLVTVSGPMSVVFYPDMRDRNSMVVRMLAPVLPVRGLGENK